MTHRRRTVISGRGADLVAATAGRSPGSLAVVDGDLRLSWSDLDARVQDAAARLAAAGARPGARVAVLGGPSAAFVVLLHAARRAGVVLVPLAPRGAVPELAWQIAHATPTLLVHEGSRASLAAAVLEETPPGRRPRPLLLDDLGAEGPPAESEATHERHARSAATHAGPVTHAWPAAAAAAATASAAAATASAADAVPLPAAGAEPLPTAAATILYTSGTTGRPRGAILTWSNHEASAAAWASALDPRPSDRWLLALPVHHVAGIGTIVRAALAGSAVVCAGDGFDADRVRDLIGRERITHVSVVAATLDRLLDALPAGWSAPSLRAVLLGGGPWRTEAVRRALAAGLPIVTTYGMTETASGVTALPTDLVARHPGASGRALAGATVSVEIDGRPAHPGEVGEIVVAGPMVFDGYLGDPAATDLALVGGRLRTGDLGSLDADGLLTVADRRDDLIVSGGENVYPAEVEAVLREHPAVLDAGVVGVPDARWGAVPVAVVTLRDGLAVDPTAIRAYARERLAGHKVPARVVVAPAIPRTAAGKILRRDLRAAAEDVPERAAPASAGPASAGPASAESASAESASAESAGASAPCGSSAVSRAAVAYSVSGSGPGVVLLHATLSRARAWLPVERGLVRRARVVAIDRRGHRASPDPDPMRLTIADHVADVASVIEREGMAPALVVGHSFGGCVALELAARRPDLVSAVVAYEPPYLAVASARVRAELARVGAATAAAHGAGDGPLAAETFLRAVLGDAGYAALPAGVRAAVLREGDAAASDAQFAGLEPAGLSRIHVPVTIVVGTASGRLYREVADALAAAIPTAVVVDVPGADHMAPVSHPETILPIIDGALDAVASR